MKKEKNVSAENKDGMPPAKQKAAKVRKSKKQPVEVRLPFLLELAYTVSTIILMLLGLMILITSYLAGAGLFTIVFRTGVAILVVGALLMLIVSQISSGLLFSVKVDREEEQKKQEEALTMRNEELYQVEA